MQDTLALKETCVVEGDLHIRRLAVELDATFNGNCKMITEEEFAQLTSGEQPAMYSVEEEKPVQEDAFTLPSSSPFSVPSAGDIPEA